MCTLVCVCEEGEYVRVRRAVKTSSFRARSRKVYQNLPGPKSLLLSLYQVSLVFGGRRHRLWIKMKRRKWWWRKGGETVGIVWRGHRPPELCSGSPEIYDVIARSSVIREPRPLLPSSLSRLST